MITLSFISFVIFIPFWCYIKKKKIGRHPCYSWKCSFNWCHLLNTSWQFYHPHNVMNEYQCMINILFLIKIKYKINSNLKIAIFSISVYSCHQIYKANSKLINLCSILVNMQLPICNSILGLILFILNQRLLFTSTELMS